MTLSSAGFGGKAARSSPGATVGIAEPVERLDSIRTQMQALKDSGEAVAGETLTSLAGFAPPVLLALAERVAKRVPQRNVNTVATNVPGPQYPLCAPAGPPLQPSRLYRLSMRCGGGGSRARRRAAFAPQSGMFRTRL